LVLAAEDLYLQERALGKVGKGSKSQITNFEMICNKNVSIVFHCYYSFVSFVVLYFMSCQGDSDL
jgi:hypothetical protein